MKTDVKISEVVKSRLSDNGRVVIPAELREKMEVKPGDVLYLSLEDGVLKIETHLARIRRIQESLRKLIPPGGPLLSDELIADRREEARREMGEGLG